MTLLRFEFMQQALVACTVVSAAAPVVGTFIVQRQQSLLGDGIGHVAFAGIGLAFLLGVAPAWGALGLAVVAAVALFALQRGGLGGDLALAILFYGGIAFGFLFASRSGAGVNQVLGFLFGSPLNMTWAGVAWVVVLSLVVLAVVTLLYGPLVALAFDEPSARVGGVPTTGLSLALTVVVALVVVGGMNALGLLLISAMMVVPVAAAAQIASSYRGTIALAAALGALSAVVGLVAAFYGDYTPGASIVITAIGCYLVTTGVGHLQRRVRAKALA